MQFLQEATIARGVFRNPDTSKRIRFRFGPETPVNTKSDFIGFKGHLAFDGHDACSFRYMKLGIWAQYRGRFESRHLPAASSNRPLPLFCRRNSRGPNGGAEDYAWTL